MALSLRLFLCICLYSPCCFANSITIINSTGTKLFVAATYHVTPVDSGPALEEGFWRTVGWYTIEPFSVGTVDINQNRKAFLRIQVEGTKDYVTFPLPNKHFHLVDSGAAFDIHIGDIGKSIEVILNGPQGSRKYYNQITDTPDSRVRLFYEFSEGTISVTPQGMQPQPLDRDFRYHAWESKNIASTYQAPPGTVFAGYQLTEKWKTNARVAWKVTHRGMEMNGHLDGALNSEETRHAIYEGRISIHYLPRNQNSRPSLERETN
jgi:hypothetical protein